MIELTVKDMTCNHCVGVVTKAVKSVDPNATVNVDLSSKRVQVDSVSSVGAFTKALEDAGYPASPLAA
ncbi:MAG: heavy-metal-associated domain-containing protein [Burkholderiales bacterium]